MNTNINKDAVKQTLREVFPHWMPEEITDVKAFFFANSSNKEFQKDPELLVTILNDTCMNIKRQAHEKQNVRYFKSSFKNEILKHIRDNQKHKVLMKLGDSLQIAAKESERKDIDSIDKLWDFFRTLDRSGILKGKYAILKDHMEKVITDLTNDLGPLTFESSINDFWAAVYISITDAGETLSDDYFYKLKSEVKAKIREKLPDSKGMLELINATNKEETVAHNILHAAFSSIDNSENESLRKSNENNYSQEDYAHDKRSDEEVIYDEILGELIEILTDRTNKNNEDKINDILMVLDKYIKEHCTYTDEEPEIYLEKNPLVILIIRILEELIGKGLIDIEILCKVIGQLNTFF